MMRRLGSVANFVEWQAYQKIRGLLGPQRMDLLAAMLMYVTLGNPRAELADLLPKWRQDPRLANPAEFYDQTMEQMEQPE